jgi:hypothetical protein
VVEDTAGRRVGIFYPLSYPQQHLIERYMRTDSPTLKLEVTIEDLAACAAPWTTTNGLPAAEVETDGICVRGKRKRRFPHDR